MVSSCYIQADRGEESSLISTDMLQEESQLSILPSDLESLDVLNQHELSFPLPGGNNNENLVLVLSGRLPLAVLHLHQMNDFVADKEPHDTFTEVRDIGRAVAYELFLKVMHVTFSLTVTNYNENNQHIAII